MGMWGVYPEARDWNVGALCSNFNLGERKSPRAPNSALFLKVPNFNAPGAFLCSPNLKSKHRAPTFQSLVSGLTPYMHIFRGHEIFTFLWLGPILRSISWPLKVLQAHFFYNLSLTYIPNGSKKC